MQFLDQVIDVFVEVQRHEPMVFETVQFLDKFIDVPVAVQRHVPMVFEAVQFPDKVIDVPVAVQRHVPKVVETVQFSGAGGQTSETTRGDSTGAVLEQGLHALQRRKPVEIPQVQFLDKFGIPVVLYDSALVQMYRRLWSSTVAVF